MIVIQRRLGEASGRNKRSAIQRFMKHKMDEHKYIKNNRTGVPPIMSTTLIETEKLAEKAAKAVHAAIRGRQARIAVDDVAMQQQLQELGLIQ